MDDKKQLYIKAYVLYILAVIAMIAVIVRICYIQYGDVVPNAVFMDESGAEVTTRIDSIEPSRGRILADDYSDLVTSVPLYNVFMDLTVMNNELYQELDSLAYHLAILFPDKTKTEWETELRFARQTGDRYRKIALKVKYDVVKELREVPILRETKNKGGNM